MVRICTFYDGGKSICQYLWQLLITFSQNSRYMHFFELAGICTFSKLNTIKIAKMAENATLITRYMHFFMRGKNLRDPFRSSAFWYLLCHLDVTLQYFEHLFLCFAQFSSNY